MRPTSSQPARLFTTAKTHKFTDIKQINIDDLKLRPIIGQTGTHLYDCSKIIAQYLQPLAINEYTISDTLSFPDILRENPLDSNEEYVSYDVDSLFTSIPLGETIDFILDEIYVRKKLEPFCKKSVFKKLLNKLCKGCTFLADGKLIRQVDGCPMGGPISVVLSNIFCVKMEFDVVKPLKPKLYKHYVNDIYSKRIKNQPDQLFEKLNNYHPNIKLTIEVNPNKVLDTKIMIKNGIIETSAVVKEAKIPNHWSSAVPKKYKRNTVLGDLHRANKISSNFELEKQRIKKKYLSVNFPYNFIQSTFNSYQQKCESLIPNWLFEEKHRKTIYIRIPFCQSNEHYALKFIRKLEGLQKKSTPLL